MMLSLSINVMVGVRVFYSARIGMYLHGFEKLILPDINRRSSLGEIWEQSEV